MTKKKTKQIAALAVGTVMLASAGGLLGSTGIASAATMLVNNGVYTLDSIRTKTRMPQHSS